jgi:hypothetical protein
LQKNHIFNFLYPTFPNLQDLENAAVGAVETEDLLEQVFARVKPPEVEAAELREQNGLVDSQHVAPVLNGGHSHEHSHEHEDVLFVSGDFERIFCRFENLRFFERL